MSGSRLAASLDVAARQSGGEGFAVRSVDSQVTAALLAGRLELKPHPVWTLPEVFDWHEDPFGEVNWQAQFHMLRWLDPLRRSAAHAPGAREMWLRVARNWARANVDEPQTRWETEGMVAGIRAIALTLGLPLAEDPAWILSALERHVDWLSDERYKAIGNHALWQVTGLFVAASALGRSGVQQSAADRLEQHVLAEYDDEGVNAEGALAYHLNNYRWTTDALRRFELEGFQLSEARRRLDGALHEIVHATRPDGLLETIGDTAAARLVGVRSPEVDYIYSKGQRGAPPREVSATFRAGYAFGRTGWGETRRGLVDETFYSVMWGPADRLHGHQDGGSVTYFSGGGPVLIDAGKYGYNRSEMRTYISSRRAHNVVDLPDRRYDPRSVVRLVANSANDAYDSYLLEDGGYEGAHVSRAVVFSRQDEWLLTVDQVTADSPGTAIARWHVDPRFAVRLDGRRAELSSRDSSGFRIAWSAETTGEVVAGARHPIEGWSATGWNQAVPAPVIRVPLATDGCRVATVVSHGEGDTGIGAIEESADAAVVEVRGAGGSAWVVLREGRAPEVSPLYPSGWAEGTAGDDAPPVLDVTAETALAGETLCTELLASAALDEESRRKGALAAIGTAQGIGLTPSWDYGLGSVLADIGEPSTRFAARRPSLLTDELEYRGKTYPVAHFSAGEALRLPDRPSVHTFATGPSVLPGLYLPAGGDVLFVGFAGAVDRGRTTLPLFQGAALHASLPGPSVLFSDPTLDLDADLRLGWYLGTLSVDVHQVIAETVRRYMAAAATTKVVLVGGSGGGFAALQVAARLEGAAVVAFSPQASVNAYHPRFRDHALRAVFGTSGPRRQDEERLDLVARYRSRPVDARVWYVQNSGDRFHVDHHARPFVEALESSDFKGTLEYQEMAMGEGHVSPTRDTYLECVERAARS